MSKAAQSVIAVVVLAGASSLGYALLMWRRDDLLQFVIFLALSIIASRIKLRLPGLDGNMSMNLPLTIISTLVFSPSKAVLITGISTCVQCLPKSLDRRKLLQLVFSVCNMMNAVALAYLVLHYRTVRHVLFAAPLRLIVAAAVLLVAEILPVAGMIALTSPAKFKNTSASLLQLTFPFFVLSAGLAEIATAIQQIGWQAPTAVLLIMWCVYRSYRLYFRQEMNSGANSAQLRSCAAAP